MTDIEHASEADHRQVIGWVLPASERERLLARFPPRYERPVADHVTLRSGVAEDAPPPAAATAEIIGEADDGEGVQALVVEIDGSAARPGGGTYHITWSLGPMRQARESNDVIAPRGWTPLRRETVRLEPGRFYG
jgi:hypothetical protein